MHAQNQSLLDALNACIAACEHCATACLQEDDVKMMARCISLDRDCADVCALTARLVARGAEVCKACGDECAQHTHMPHCQACAEACRRCEEACRQGLQAA